MPEVSIIMPTYKRRELIARAVNSVLAQTYKDWELIIVDDCPEQSAENVVKNFNDPRIIYLKHEKNKGGAAARNTGIRNARGEFIAFLDDDDEWLPQKLEVQMKKLKDTPREVGFCFSAVRNIYDNYEEDSKVKDGINDYHKIALTRFKGFLTSSLVVKKNVFNDCGMFDETLPSSQEAELILRITKKYKGLGISRSLVRMTMISGHEHINSDIKRKILGRERVLEKHSEELQNYPEILARHYFWLALWYRDDGRLKAARETFKKAFCVNFKFRYLFHYLFLMVKAFFKKSNE